MEQEFQNPIEEEIGSFQREALEKARKFGANPYRTPEGSVVVQFGNTLLLEFTSDRDGLVASLASAERRDTSFPLEYVNVMLDPAKLAGLKAYGAKSIVSLWMRMQKLSPSRCGKPITCSLRFGMLETLLRKCSRPIVLRTLAHA